MRGDTESNSDKNSKNELYSTGNEAVDNSPYGADVDQIVADSALYSEEEYRRVRRKVDL